MIKVREQSPIHVGVQDASMFILVCLILLLTPWQAQHFKQTKMEGGKFYCCSPTQFLHVSINTFCVITLVLLPIMIS